jgi:IS4 transposase
MTGGLEDVVGPLFTEATMISTVAPATSPKLMREKEPRMVNVEEGETYDISFLFASPTPQRFVPHEEVVATLDAMVPRRSKRVAEQCDGEYIRVMDRAVQRKVREVEGLEESS